MDISDQFDGFKAQVKDFMKQTRKQQDDSLGELEGYCRIIDEISDMMTTLVETVDKQVQLRTIRSRVVWSVAVASTVIGVLAIWWASGRNVGFSHDLLEAVGAALVTFSLVEVFLHSVIGIPTKAARKQDKAVELVKAASKKMAEYRTTFLPGVEHRIAELKKLYVQLDAQIEAF